MLGNFIYSNPTKFILEDALQYLGEELSKYGKNVQLIYGGGSIKKNGIYEQVMELLKANGKAVVELLFYLDYLCLIGMCIFVSRYAGKLLHSFKKRGAGKWRAGN